MLADHEKVQFQYKTRGITLKGIVLEFYSEEKNQSVMENTHQLKFCSHPNTTKVLISYKI